MGERVEANGSSSGHSTYGDPPTVSFAAWPTGAAKPPVSPHTAPVS